MMKLVPALVIPFEMKHYSVYHVRGKYHGRVNNHGHAKTGDPAMERVRVRRPSEQLFERAVADVFRHARWEVVSHPSLGRFRPDLLVRRGDRQYVVEVKSSPEARRDRLVPIFAQAILQAKAAGANLGKSPDVLPLAVIGVPHVSESLFEALRSFAAQFAPDVSVGIIDMEGSRLFAGPGLDALSKVSPSSNRPRPLPGLAPPLHLFSDLNQWMIKVLLSPRISRDLLNAPLRSIGGVSELARVAGVSVMSAFRCVSSLRNHGFIDEQSSALRIVNVEELLQQWRAASGKPVRELPMRWIIAGNPEKQLRDAVRAYLNLYNSDGGRRKHGGLPYPRICLSLFAAAELLGFGFVRGVAPHMYLERFDQRALEALGLVPARAGQRADVLLRIPSFRESVFRAAVMREGVPVSDVLQVWLDVSDHRARGANQAQEIWRRVLGQLSQPEKV